MYLYISARAFMATHLLVLQSLGNKMNAAVMWIMWSHMTVVNKLVQPVDIDSALEQCHHLRSKITIVVVLLLTAWCGGCNGSGWCCKLHCPYVACWSFLVLCIGGGMRMMDFPNCILSIVNGWQFAVRAYFHVFHYGNKLCFKNLFG